MIVSDDDIALEEASTVFETLARYSPYRHPDVPSYHAGVSKDRDDAYRKIKEDREPVAGTAEPGSKGLRGKCARDATDKKFRESHISNLVLGGSPKSAKQHLDELSKKNS